MKINVAWFRPLVLACRCLVNFPVAPSRAQEVSIPDPGSGNQLTNLTLPADMTRFVMFGHIDQVIMPSLAKNRGRGGGSR